MKDQSSNKRQCVRSKWSTSAKPSGHLQEHRRDSVMTAGLLWQQLGTKCERKGLRKGALSRFLVISVSSYSLFTTSSFDHHQHSSSLHLGISIMEDFSPFSTMTHSRQHIKIVHHCTNAPDKDIFHSSLLPCLSPTPKQSSYKPIGHSEF